MAPPSVANLCGFSHFPGRRWVFVAGDRLPQVIRTLQQSNYSIPVYGVTSLKLSRLDHTVLVERRTASGRVFTQTVRP